MSNFTPEMTKNNNVVNLHRTKKKFRAAKQDVERERLQLGSEEKYK